MDAAPSIIAATDLWVFYVPLAISALTFALYVADTWRRSRVDYHAKLERELKEQAAKIASLQAGFEECERDRRALHFENHELMQRILRLERA